MGLSSCLILLGSGIIYSYTGITNIESVYDIVSVYFNKNITISHSSTILDLVNNTNQIGVGVIFGLLLIFSGFLFKIAASPFHNWAPAWRFGSMPLWVELSNIGKPLKPLKLDLIRKTISG